MKKKNVCVVITARPSYSRIKTALVALEKYEHINLQLVVAASALLDNYGKVIKEIEKDGFEIAAKVYNVVSGENLNVAAKTTGLGIIELSTVFDNIKPDVVLTIADRFETMATAITAAYKNIPLIHIQGGEVTGNIDEKVRHAITKLADVHFVATNLAQQRVIRMGENPDRVFITGCPSIDIAAQIQRNFKNMKFDPIQKYNGVGKIVDNRDEYVVVMLHPLTTEINKARKQTECVLKTVETFDKQVYWFWPNVDAGSDNVSRAIRRHRENISSSHIYFFKNMSPEDFLVLLLGSQCIIGNSSVAIRECSYLGVPAINIGNRQQGRERGKNVIDVSFDCDEITMAYRRIISGKRPQSDSLYGDGKAGERIAKIIAEMENIPIDKILQY